LIRPDDAGDLAEKVTRALLDADLRRRVAEAGRAHAEAIFTQAAATARTLAVFEQVLAQRQRGKE
jgi:glycosyltransferase involved in cell wall biosynthesis